MQFAFKQLNLRKINLEVASYNKKAIELYKSFGFKIEGVFREQIYMDGLYYNKICMGIFSDEYFNLYPQYTVTEIHDESFLSRDKTELNQIQ